MCIKELIMMLPAITKRANKEAKLNSIFFRIESVFQLIILKGFSLPKSRSGNDFKGYLKVNYW